jgi:hypothetical protein
VGRVEDRAMAWAQQVPREWVEVNRTSRVSADGIEAQNCSPCRARPAWGTEPGASACLPVALDGRSSRAHLMPDRSGHLAVLAK